MNITIQIDDKEHPIDDGVQDVSVESADVVCITTPMDDKEQAILGFMMKDCMQSDELKRLRCENEKLSATIDKVRIAMRKRGSVVAIQTVNQVIYEHDHIDENMI